MRAQIRILPGKGKEELQVGLKVLGLKIIVFSSYKINYGDVIHRGGNTVNNIVITLNGDRW